LGSRLDESRPRIWKDVLNMIFPSGKQPAEKQASFPERSIAAQISKTPSPLFDNHPIWFFPEKT
jgi:hypothetical protein